MSIDGVLFPQPLQVPATQPAKPRQAPATGGATPFARILEEKLPAGQLRFSQHARERLQTRGIDLSPGDLDKLTSAVDSLARKGGRESLVMLGDAAFVVSVRNRTVVTALDREQLQNNVFTNIDSALVL